MRIITFMLCILFKFMGINCYNFMPFGLFNSNTYFGYVLFYF